MIDDDDDESGQALAATMDSLTRSKIGAYQERERSPHEQVSALRLQSLDLARAGAAQVDAMKRATESGDDAGVLAAQSAMDRIKVQFSDTYAKTKALADKFGLVFQPNVLGAGGITGNR